MANKIIVQTQTEFANMNRDFIKFLFLWFLPILMIFIVYIFPIEFTGSKGKLYAIAFIWIGLTIYFKYLKKALKKKKNHKRKDITKISLIIICLILLISLSFFYLNFSKNENNTSKFLGTDWASLGDSSPKVEEFCRIICKPQTLQGYANNINHNSIECSCSKRKIFIDYETLKEISQEEFQKRIDFFLANK